MTDTTTAECQHTNERWQPRPNFEDAIRTTLPDGRMKFTPPPGRHFEGIDIFCSDCGNLVSFMPNWNEETKA